MRYLYTPLFRIFGADDDVVNDQDYGGNDGGIQRHKRELSVKVSFFIKIITTIKRNINNNCNKMHKSQIYKRFSPYFFYLLKTYNAVTVIISNIYKLWFLKI